jgi:acetyl-CoA C-acetyltransferase
MRIRNEIVMMAAQAIQCGDAEIVVAGGMENEFSSALYAFENWNQIWSPMIDGLQKMDLVL